MNPTENLSALLTLLPAVRHSPPADCRPLTNKRGDVLYVHFGRKPRPATDSKLTDDDIIVRYDGEEIIGITILHASQR